MEKQREAKLLKEKIRKLRMELLPKGDAEKILGLQNSRIVQTFKCKMTGNIKFSMPTDDEWNKLIRQFSRTVPNVYSAIGKENILSELELRICILLILGFENGNIVILLGTSPQSVTNARKKANKKLFGEETASTLEKNLMKTIGMV